MEFRVSDIAVARGGVPVLERVSFTLRAGEALILRGPNGIGKTTLLRTLAGLQPCLAGEVPAEAQELIAYASHADGLKTMLSVRENLAFWAQAFGTQDIGPALSLYDLHALEDRLAGSLSAGQKRRLGLARLMVTGRKIWALDEPTVSLDTRAVEMFGNAVRGHLEAGGAALIATHIDLGLSNTQTLDLEPFKAAPESALASDEAFL